VDVDLVDHVTLQIFPFVADRPAAVLPRRLADTHRSSATPGRCDARPSACVVSTTCRPRRGVRRALAQRCPEIASRLIDKYIHRLITSVSGINPISVDWRSPISSRQKIPNKSNALYQCDRRKAGADHPESQLSQGFR
jgi:hypothetical protein